MQMLEMSDNETLIKIPEQSTNHPKTVLILISVLKWLYEQFRL